MASEVFAPAKINLTLHVTGRREDGYHTLDSLVSFAPVGDLLTISEGDGLSLRVSGPEAAGVPEDGSNLVVKAAALLGGEADLKLHKALPAASGIGGGSADAAATLRGVAGRAGDDGSAEALLATHGEQILALGADVPMCLYARPLRAEGIGDALTPLALPPVAAVLVNPRLQVSTPAVFRALERRDNTPMPADLPPMSDAAELIAFLSEMRNDLQAPACAVQPAIHDVLARITAQPGCKLARMSGSGATCFGLFLSEGEAAAAAEAIAVVEPGWWVASGVLGDCSALAAPRGQ
jgi:4-diphosphocytidyl-2-C-methyl-D-erythritol kinase